MAIIRDVGESLKKFLQQKISELSDENSIIFDSPADIEPAANTRLSIFLYQIVENSFLRNVESEPVGIDQMRYPPLTLDLHYLFTPYAKNRETELIILERLIQVFHDNAVFKGKMLTESLKGSGNEEIRVVPETFKFEDINKLWERFPNRAFKLSVSYILTPVTIPSEITIKIKRVVEKDMGLHRMGGEK